MTIAELREARAKALADARTIHEAGEAEDRDLTTEEEARYKAFLVDHGKLGTRIERQEALEKEQAALDADANPERRSGRPYIETAGDGTGNGDGIPDEFRGNPFAGKEYRAGFASYLDGKGQTESVRKALEVRALQSDSDILGGYITTPPQFVAQLIKSIDDLLFIRTSSTVIPVATATSLGVPSLDADPADADWTSELLTGSEDSTMAFGKRELNPSPLAKRILVSNKLMRTAVMSPETLVRDRLAYKFAVTQEKAFLTGTGAQQPLGVMTASSDGISTGRDVSTGNTTTSITTDGLKNAKYSLKGGYWGGAQWIFHRDGVSQIAKLKDGDGRYLWQDSIVQGEPDRVYGFPVRMSEYQSNTFTTGLYVGILGDFKWFWIADALSMQVQRLTELYAATNQVGFIGRLETDAMPVLEEAFARVKLA